MPKVVVAPHGVNGGFTGRGNSNPGKRGEVKGWSKGSARRNRRFLMRVDTDQLTGVGVAMTLTVGRTPESGDEWRRIVRNFLFAVKRRGALRWHWVVEWQARGAPHLHLSIYFEEAGSYWAPVELVNHWLTLTSHLGSGPHGQHFDAIRTPGFWAQYLAKHAARGQEHYQRQREALPDEWNNTGRLWGKGGDWPERTAEYDIDERTYFRFRRLVWKWSRAKARTALAAGEKWRNPRQIRAAKRGLKTGRGLPFHNAPETSRLGGIGLFCPEQVAMPLLKLALGHETAFVAPSGAKELPRRLPLPQRKDRES